MRFGPAGVHAQQHLGPVLGFGAAGAGVDLEEAVVGVGLARKQALELEPAEPVPELAQRGLRLGHGLGVALLLGQLGQRQSIREFLLQLALPLDRGREARALAHDRLGALAVTPELRVGGRRAQLVEAFERAVPVKDASSAGRWPARSPRRDG